MNEKVKELSDGRLRFTCPGCKINHAVRVNPNDGTRPHWDWNGSKTSPTFSPSILVQHGLNQICHSFVKEGQIQFLSDCTHELAGQTVELDAEFPSSGE